MSAQQGTQSPPPERQTGAQLQDPPANGQGVDKSLSKEALQAQLDKLESNPKSPMDDAVKEKFAKTASKPSS